MYQIKSHGTIGHAKIKGAHVAQHLHTLEEKKPTREITACIISLISTNQLSTLQLNHSRHALKHNSSTMSNPKNH